MNKGTSTSLLVILAAVTCMASADITLEVVPIDNSGPAELNGYVTQDLVVTTDTDWEQAHLVVTLDEPGQIYQDALGGTDPGPPNPAFFDLAPSLEFDTYLMPDLPDVSIPQDPPWSGTFDHSVIDVSWHSGFEDEIGELPLARLSLAETANGTWEFWATAASENDPRVDVPAGVVVNGEMFIPEPVTLSLLTLGGLAVLRRKRK